MVPTWVSFVWIDSYKHNTGGVSSLRSLFLFLVPGVQTHTLVYGAPPALPPCDTPSPFTPPFKFNFRSLRKGKWWLSQSRFFSFLLSEGAKARFQGRSLSIHVCDTWCLHLFGESARAKPDHFWSPLPSLSVTPPSFPWAASPSPKSASCFLFSFILLFIYICISLIRATVWYLSFRVWFFRLTLGFPGAFEPVLCGHLARLSSALLFQVVCGTRTGCQPQKRNVWSFTLSVFEPLLKTVRWRNNQGHN